MKNIRFFLSENVPFLVIKVSIYLNRCIFVMYARVRFTDTTHHKHNSAAGKMINEMKEETCASLNYQ